MQAKPFNLLQALQGHPLITRTGERAINFTKLPDYNRRPTAYNFVAVINGTNKTFTCEGRYNVASQSHDYDLFMEETTHLPDYTADDGQPIDFSLYRIVEGGCSQCAFGNYKKDFGNRQCKNGRTQNWCKCRVGQGYELIGFNKSAMQEVEYYLPTKGETILVSDNKKTWAPREFIRFETREANIDYPIVCRHLHIPEATNVWKFYKKLETKNNNDMNEKLETIVISGSVELKEALVTTIRRKYNPGLCDIWGGKTLYEDKDKRNVVLNLKSFEDVITACELNQKVGSVTTTLHLPEDWNKALEYADEILNKVKTTEFKIGEFNGVVVKEKGKETMIKVGSKEFSRKSLLALIHALGKANWVNANGNGGEHLPWVVVVEMVKIGCSEFRVSDLNEVIRLSE